MDLNVDDDQCGRVVGVSRIQLALSVADLEGSVAFYSTLFGVEPHKRRPGYANFAIEQPPLKLVLIEVPTDTRRTGVYGALNHLGVEVESMAEVEASAARLREAGLAAFDEKDTTCCYALQDKVWVHDPAGAPWEIYTVKEDDPANPRDGHDRPVNLLAGDGACCTPEAGFVSSSGDAAETAQATACC
jgi:catechol 2,3-dioxygenase-like lactoylglutathione lyase family enzyme